jgi:hypothetical protein
VTNPDEQLLRQIALRNWLILGGLVLASLLWRSSSVSLGVLAGGLVAIAGHYWRYIALKKLLDIPGSGSRGSFQIGYFIRLTALVAVVYLLIVKVEVHPLALIVGLSTVVINILMTTVKGSI